MDNYIALHASQLLESDSRGLGKKDVLTSRVSICCCLGISSLLISRFVQTPWVTSKLLYQTLSDLILLLSSLVPYFHMRHIPWYRQVLVPFGERFGLSGT